MAYAVERFQQFGYKTEVTELTPETLTTANLASVVYSADIVPSRASNERRPIRANGMTALQARGGALIGSVTARLEARGSGSDGTAPDWYALLRAAGATVSTDVASFGAAVTSTPEIGTSVTCAHQDGLYTRTLAGTRGSVKLVAAGAGQPIMVEFEGRGRYTQAVGTTFVASAQPSAGVAPVLLGSALSLGGASLEYKSIELAIENEVTPIEDGSHSSGFGRNIITAQKLIARISAWETTSSTDWFSKFANDDTGDTLAFSWAFGSGTGGVFTCTGTVHLIEEPVRQYEAGIGIRRLVAEFQTTSDTAALAITQS